MSKNYKIIIDSSGDLPQKLKNNIHFDSVPYSIILDGIIYIDDETFVQADFLQHIANSPNLPKSACPSPDSYLKACECDAQNIYIITISGVLSGSYNSAILAKKLYNEEHENNPKNIYVFDSKSTSLGETLIGLKIQEYEEKGYSFKEIINKVEEYISSMHTFFILDNLDTLIKTGRIKKYKADIISTLNIKPIMAANEEGAIYNLSQGRGTNGAISKLIRKIIDVTTNPEEKIIAISHCNCPKKAEFAKKQVENLANFKDIITINMSGLTSMYSNQGGIIVVA